MTILTWETTLGLVSLGALLGVVVGLWVGWFIGFQAGESSWRDKISRQNHTMNVIAAALNDSLEKTKP